MTQQMAQWEIDLERALDYEGDDLTAWDVEFINSLDKQRQRGGDSWSPSPRQREILSLINDKF